MALCVGVIFPKDSIHLNQLSLVELNPVHCTAVSTHKPLSVANEINFVVEVVFEYSVVGNGTTN